MTTATRPTVADTHRHIRETALCARGRTLGAHFGAEVRDLTDLARRAARGSFRAEMRVAHQIERRDEAVHHYWNHVTDCKECK